MMTLKSACSLSRPLSEVAEVFARRRSPEHVINQYFTADALTLNAEVEWASSRKGSQAREIIVDHTAPKAFERSLTRGEAKHLANFRDGCERGRVWSLRCNPVGRGFKFRQVSSDCGVMYILTKSAGFHWADFLDRFFTMWVSSSERVPEAQSGEGHGAGRQQHACICGRCDISAMFFRSVRAAALLRGVVCKCRLHFP